MNKILRKYLITSYSQTFFPIFFTLYTITSIVYLVKIASLTSVIQINFVELLELYSYSVPTILFYTLPISIFIAMSLGLAKLSNEYELIVITSFGLNPRKIIRLILPTLLLSTLLMIIVSLALIPKADNMKDIFLYDKQVESQFNIKASEYGQEFGDWLLYVNEEKNGIYKDIVLFQHNVEEKEDTFIIAKFAELKNNKQSLNLSLSDGKVIKVKENVNQVNFKRMVINNQLKQLVNINTVKDLLNYWEGIKKDKGLEKDFTFYILISFLPIFSLLFIISVGYYNPRYEKNKSTVWGLLLATFYVLVAQKLAKDIGLLSLLYIPTIWIVLSYILYRYKIRPYY